MANRNPSNSATKNQTKNRPKTPRANACHWTICEDAVIDRDSEYEGQDAIFCEGSCQGWLYRGCAGLTISAFKFYSESSRSFFCSQCQLQAHYKELTELKSIVGALRAELSQLKHTNSSTESPTGTPISTPSLKVNSAHVQSATPLLL